MPRALPSFLIGLLFASAAIAADAWPQWRGPNRDAISQESNLRGRWDGPPTLIWKAEGVGIGYAGVVVDHSIVCTMGERNGKMALITLSDKDGKEIWEAEIGEAWPGGDYPGSRCTPTVDGDQVYAISPNGDLVCLDLATGRRIWKKSFREQYYPPNPNLTMWGFSESPLVDGDKLVCTPGGREAGVVAFHKRTGQELWRCGIVVNGQATGGGTSFSSIVVSHGAGVRQYVQALGEGALVGIEAETGKQLWAHMVPGAAGHNMCTPIVRGDYVFANVGYGSGSVLLKLTRVGDDVKVKQVYFLGQRELSTWSGGSVLVGDYFYMCHWCGGGAILGKSGVVKCIEFSTGKTIWSEKGARGSGQAAVIYADGNLYFRYQSGVVDLVAATAERYQLKGRFRTPSKSNRSFAHPAIANGRLYLREQDVIYCYDLKKR